MDRIERGDWAKDTVTDFEGTITGKCTYLTGCDQYSITTKVTGDEHKSTTRWFDETRIEILRKNVVKLHDKPEGIKDRVRAVLSGGPQETPPDTNG